MMTQQQIVRHLTLNENLCSPLPDLISFTSKQSPAILGRMKKKSADEFPQELWSLFDRYVHREMDRTRLRSLMKKLQKLAWTRTVDFFKTHLK